MRYTLRLPSHSLFVAEVVALHASPDVLNDRQEVDLEQAGAGLAYRAGVVRERPVDNFRPDELRQQVHRWKDGNQ